MEFQNKTAAQAPEPGGHRGVSRTFFKLRKKKSILPQAFFCSCSGLPVVRVLIGQNNP